MITLYRAFLLLVMILTALMIPEASRLPTDSQYTIGPGFMPIVMIGITIVCCVALLIMDFIHKSDAHVKRDAYKRLLLYLLATALLVLGMRYVGIAVSLFVYLLLVPWLVEKHTFLSSLKLAGVTTLVIYLIFHVWLKVPMTILNFLNI
jgi:hypothetical protein